ncbi:hypothetical protein SAMN05216357_11071 [Porphyromonadaceae bacterium KH3CP3RA]|nr:hypothetical protein SAMN05216357_11071 [Porphyromonadaceae bacterium KH3CP3RA]
MVKRFPHTAIVTYGTEGGMVNGEWVEGKTETVEITGRFDPVSTNNVIRINDQGNEVIVRGEFYTPIRKIEGATILEVPELGIKRNIICWWPFQSHNVISV